ncbi:CxxH/CxxC protein [Microaerobacter geothermalis]|uniref:CxxH/CxxC protein n=1 Tax=Microaerobacter geothermalis TaxID=674972 RepID=UPI001F1BA22A|nr:CxxH/CxxC protein [Microaerobacter geothermalis]MCF6094645.1 CxxH/CxxC protein [Microaerobacter geothermalis]
MVVCCSEHLELAIDYFVDEYEEAPDLYRLDEVSFTAWTVPATCEFCDRIPKFLVV